MSDAFTTIVVVPSLMADCINDIADQMDGDPGPVVQAFFVMGLHMWSQANNLPGLAAVCGKWLIRYCADNGITATFEVLRPQRTWESDLAEDR